MCTVLIRHYRNGIFFCMNTDLWRWREFNLRCIIENECSVHNAHTILQLKLTLCRQINMNAYQISTLSEKNLLNFKMLWNSHRFVGASHWWFGIGTNNGKPHCEPHADAFLTSDHINNVKINLFNATVTSVMVNVRYEDTVHFP